MMEKKAKKKGLAVIISTLMAIGILSGCTKSKTSVATNDNIDSISEKAVNKVLSTSSSDNATTAVIVKKNELALVNLKNNNVTTLDSPGSFSHPILSKDKNHIAYLKDTALYVVNIKGEKEKVHDNIAMESFQWLDKDNLLYSPETGGIYIYNVSSKTAKAFVENKFNYQNITIGEKKNIYAEKYLYYEKEDGKYIADYGIVLFQPDTKEEEILVKSIPASEDGTDLGMYPIISSISKDYRFLYIFQHPHAGSLAADGVALAVYDLKAKKFIPCNNENIITLHYEDNYSSNALDSENIAFINGAGREMNYNKTLGILNVVKGSFQPLSSPQETAMTPYFCSDGKTLLYASSKATNTSSEEEIAQWMKNQNICSLDMDTKKVTQVTNSSTSFDFSPMYIDDKNFVFFRLNLASNTTDDNAGYDISMWKLENGKEIKLTDNVKIEWYYGHFDTYNFVDIK